MSAIAKVLFVDDDEEALLSLIRALKAESIIALFHAASSEEKAIELFLQEQPEVVVLDLHLNEARGVESGFALLRRFISESQSTRVIVLTGHGSVEHGVRALSVGAANFLEKPANIPHLAALINDGIKQAALRAELEVLRKNNRQGAGLGIIGVSKVSIDLAESISYAAQNKQPVLITGETGTGKGLCAFQIHRLSKRSGHAFVRYQPTFLTPDLVNSELFGHIKGAFTGATASRNGLITEANQGTLFLDEIDELPLESQVSLLGVMQDRKFRQVGSNKEQEADFRLIAASNQDFPACVDSGKLRKDLYHRIAHLRIHIPALRERKEDIEILSRHALRQLFEREEVSVQDFSDGALRILLSHDWPGNVRELFAVVEGAAYHASYKGRSGIEVEDLRFYSAESDSKEQGFHEDVEAFKLKLIEDALFRNNGNQVAAAKEIGLDRSSMRRLLARGRGKKS